MSRKGVVALSLPCLIVSSLCLAAEPIDRVTPRVLKFSASLSPDPMAHFEPGVIGMTFSIYKDRGDETPLWTTTQNVAIDADGRFTVLLGDAEKDGIPIEIFTSGEARWLGMQRIPEREMERIMLASVPYALKAADADSLGGKPLSAFVLSEAAVDRKLKPVVDGAAGFIAKFVDTTNIDNSILFESAGRLGLSTTSPQAPLHINSVVTYRNAGVGSIQRGNNPGIMLENPLTNSSVLLSESFGFVVFASTSATVPLAGSDQRFVVRPSGNVGIAVNNPLVPLHIAGVKTYRGLNTTTVQSGTNPGLMLENPATNSTVALTENSGLSIYTSPSSTLPFTGSDLKMVVNTAGNVGIGVSAPAQKLEVAGNVKLTNNLMLPDTASTAAGVIRFGAFPFIHNFGSVNTFVGSLAGNMTMTGSFNVAIGSQALGVNATGNSNVAAGVSALANNTDGTYNTAIGSGSLAQNTTGSNNTVSGGSAMGSNTTGNYNTAYGGLSMSSNVSGSSNTAYGVQSLFSNTAGGTNTALGHNALFSTTGSSNIGVGFDAGTNLTSGGSNIDIGAPGVAAESFTIRIGTGGTHTRAFVAGIRNVTTGAANAVGVVIDSNGQLGTVSSSRRYKFDIHEMDNATSDLMRLRPVTFRYLKHGDHAPLQYGLIAEEVAEIFPELVARDSDGEPETVMYHFLTPMLLNQAQKEHERVEQQQKMIETLNMTVAALAQRLEALEAELANSHRSGSTEIRR
jgi:hypothetical protein